jgi:hypothetical protein
MRSVDVIYRIVVIALMLVGDGSVISYFRDFVSSDGRP